MANYTTNTSDKLKKKAQKLLLMGGLGFHLFYVGRIKYGIVRFLLGLFCWGGFITGFTEGAPEASVMVLVLLLAVNLVDYIKLSLGKFKDNVGQYLRA